MRKKKSQGEEIYNKELPQKLWLGVLIVCNILAVGALLGSMILFKSCGKESGWAAYSPDALGGFVGILLGFLLEYTVLKAFNDTRKRNALIELLMVELIGVSNAVIDNYILFMKDSKPGKVYFPVIEDTLDDADNVILFRPIFFKESSQELLLKLQALNVELLEYNHLIENLSQYTQEEKRKKLEKDTLDVVKIILSFLEKIGRVKFQGNEYCYRNTDAENNGFCGINEIIVLRDSTTNGLELEEKKLTIHIEKNETEKGGKTDEKEEE